MSVLTIDHLHPLTALIARDGTTAGAWLHRVADRHRALDFGAMACRREKVTRWTRDGVTPDRTALLAIASLHGIPEADVHRCGWPDFLHLALDDDRPYLESPWTAEGTVTLLTEVGGPVDRRGVLIATSSTLAAAVAQWSTAEPALATTGRNRRVGHQSADLFETRLDALRRLDDELGAHHVHDAALVELRLITGLLKNASYTGETGCRLLSAAAEAARIAGWCAYDTGHHRAAERHFLTSLRAAASAGDTTRGAVTLAFWANLRYSNGDPTGALHLIDGALSHRRTITSPRALAMLHARAARAHSTAGDHRAAWRRIDAAFAAYTHADTPEADLPSLYWITAGELHQVAASTALALHTPKKALAHFDAAVTHHDPYDPERELRGTVIYQARHTAAHIAIGDIDAALDTGHRILAAIDGIDSPRSTAALHQVRDHLTPHRHIPAVNDFLGQSSRPPAPPQ
ncbi:transcriptional regulator [Streptomyces sp. NPDC000594]|uniref:transcriptional regulator n=1 Tax=Streptomyces sp. NPDC000594 TaxID=3154261 RepID=UPI003331642D